MESFSALYKESVRGVWEVVVDNQVDTPDVHSDANCSKHGSH